jgi:hypothetical protein
LRIDFCRFLYSLDFLIFNFFFLYGFILGFLPCFCFNKRDFFFFGFWFFIKSVRFFLWFCLFCRLLYFFFILNLFNFLFILLVRWTNLNYFILCLRFF